MVGLAELASKKRGDQRKIQHLKILYNYYIPYKYWKGQSFIWTDIQFFISPKGQNYLSHYHALIHLRLAR